MDMLPIDWDRWGEAALVLISTIDCILLLVFSRTQTVYVMYGCYICYRTFYQVMITIAQLAFSFLSPVRMFHFSSSYELVVAFG